MAPSVSSMPSSLPSSTPSLAPSVSSAPSSSPTVSLMPSQDRVFLSSYTSGLRSGAFGVMFEGEYNDMHREFISVQLNLTEYTFLFYIAVTPKRAILVQTFAIKHFGGNNFNFRVFTKSGPIGSSYNTANAWTEIGSISYASLSSSGSSNPITLPSQGIDAVPIYTGETQSFYIACVGNYFEVREETLGTKSENNEVSIVAGLKKPENGLFHTNTQGTQSTKYMFQGKLIYSYEVDPPSASPSATPSSLPSTSSMPTVKTPFPSSEPSKSLAPTGTPITPTGAPSVSDKPTIDPFSEVHIEITVPSRMTISGFNIPTNQVEINTVITILAATLKKAASANLNTSQRIIDVKIISIGGVKVTSTQRLRSLTGGTLIEYEILLEAICATSSCDDSQEVANALYKQATDSMKAAIDDGSLATTLKQNAQAAGNADSLLTVAVDSGDFSPVIITILGLLTDFYPDWVGGGYCSNDGNEPFYMQKDASTWLYPTRAGCCDRYFSYAYNECMGSLAASSGKYYPDWTNGGDACLVDGKEPSYMKSNPDGWLYDDADSCCKRYFPWNFSKCVTSSGGTVSNLATREWYVDHAKKQCVQDCAVDATDPTCGGNANAWDSLHGTVSECCTEHLGWIKTSTCAAVSQGQTPPDSNKWYVEWSNETCVKDCEGNAPCGGLAQPWNGLFDSVVECCKTMPWNGKCGQ